MVKKMKVLIVDDSLLIRRQLSIFFEEELNYNVVGFGIGGTDTLELYKEHEPDIITLDLAMPNKNGTEALKEIMNYDPDARVLICSAIKTPGKITEALEMGAKCYIKKPFNFKDPEYVKILKDDIKEALE